MKHAEGLEGMKDAIQVPKLFLWMNIKLMHQNKLV